MYIYKVTQRLPVYTHNLIRFLTQFLYRKWENLQEWYLHVLVWCDKIHTVCLRTLIFIFKVTNTQEQQSRESLFNAKRVVHLVTSISGRLIFSCDSIFILLLKMNSQILFIYNLNCNKDDHINVTNSYFIRYHNHHHFHDYHHPYPSRDRPFQSFSYCFNSPFKGLLNRLLLFLLFFSIIFGPSLILAQKPGLCF